MDRELYTIGHSVLDEPTFIQLLKTHQIRALVDVRAFPYSKRLQHFNGSNLKVILPMNGITYLHMETLGGRRKFDPTLPDYGWRNPSFAAYAQYLHTDEFAQASEELANVAEKETTTIMCAEKLWWKCHRRLIADHFQQKGWDVKHIMSENKIDSHILSSNMKGTQQRLFGE